MAQPYAQRSFNHIETLTLALLTLLSGVVTRYAAPYNQSVQIGLFVLLGPRNFAGDSASVPQAGQVC